MLRASVCIAWTALAACSGPSAPELGASRAEVQYGPTDDRIEVFQASGVHRAIAESAIAMQMGASWIDDSDPSDVRITYRRTLAEAHDLCPGVAFADQIEPGTCSGTLIDARHVLTAGHCVNPASDCGADDPWVFGFYYESQGVLRTLASDDVYACARIVAFRDDATSDYAVIELDRDVVGHMPARVRRDPSPAPRGTTVTLIGHPNGMPMKLAGNATIRASGALELVADVDAFSGNSGSGVFDGAGELVGVLVSGNDDWEDAGGCNEIAVIDPVPGGEGENLTTVRVAIDAFCATGVRSAVCMAPVDAGATAD
ncbi:MAG: serine protease, partial [Sandaracinaceae bacterium]|nr:serine protease [Sandaracinaceae bacterium]